MGLLCASKDLGKTLESFQNDKIQAEHHKEQETHVILLAIQKGPDANTVAISDAISTPPAGFVEKRTAGRG